jgi:hypothetical protein
VQVDDVMITTPTEGGIDDLLKEIEKNYEILSVSSGKVLHYLGMVLNFEQEGVCKISMDGFVEDLLQHKSSTKSELVENFVEAKVLLLMILLTLSKRKIICRR